MRFLKWRRVGDGVYETADGRWSILRGTSRRWFITYPDELHPDAVEYSLRDAKAHVARASQ